MIAARKDDRRRDRERGEARKLNAHANLDARRGTYVRQGQRVLLNALLDGGNATIDDVRPAVPLPKGINPKLFGAVPGPLARAGIIESIGFTKTCRPKAHARPIAIWSLRDRDKALAWLADHPDLDEGPGGTLQRTLFPNPPTTPARTAATVGPAI